MTKYRKRPTEIEAWQVGSDEPMPDWVESYRDGECGMCVVRVRDSTIHVIDSGDWIVLDSIQDVIMCVKSEIFEQTYEVVE